MSVGPLVALCVPVLAALLGRRAPALLARIHPATATWCLTLLSLGIGWSTCVGVSAVAADLVLVHAGGDLPVAVLRTPPGVLATAVLCASTVTLLVTGSLPALTEAARDWWAARRAWRLRPPGGVLVVEDPEPEAYAVAGPRAVVVIHSGLLDALPADERAVVLAHERAHLDRHHGGHVLAGVAAARLNPLLAPLARAAQWSVERWADEEAAASVGDRRTAARAVSRAALARGRHRAQAGRLAMSHTGAAARACALLQPPLPTRRAAVGIALVLAGAVNVAVVAGAHSVEDGYERARECGRCATAARHVAALPRPAATSQSGGHGITGSSGRVSSRGGRPPL